MSPKGLHSCLARAREAEEYTDFTIVCQDVRMPVHKVIVCSQSPVFRTACSGLFLESSVYEIQDFTAVETRLLVEYLYSGDYDDDESLVPASPGQTKSVLPVHARVFAMADKYQVDGLMALAAKRYAKALRCTHTSSSTVDFLASLEIVYTSTPASVRPLRDAAVALARQRLDKSVLQTAPSIKNKFDEVTVQIPEFAKDLLDSYIFEPGPTIGCGHVQVQHMSRRGKMTVMGIQEEM